MNAYGDSQHLIPEADPGTSLSSLAYNYRPLRGEGLIRVLHLHTNKGESLQCRIQHIHLGELNFSAISYRWGDNQRHYQMNVRDDNNEDLGFIKLTENLRNALHDLRDATNIAPKVFWIDQISINQDDKEELARQVKMMGQIYSRANQVITYLGPQESGDDEAIELAMRIRSIFEPYYSELLNVSGCVLDKNDPLMALKDKLPTSMPGWKALASLACGEWMERLWMVPENILNKHTIILRGTRVLDWLPIGSIAMLQNFGLLPSLPFQSDNTTTCIVWEYRMAFQSGEGFCEKLLWLIGRFRFHKCQDERDSVCKSKFW
jgi:hypothetical protein